MGELKKKHLQGNRLISLHCLRGADSETQVNAFHKTKAEHEKLEASSPRGIEAKQHLREQMEEESTKFGEVFFSAVHSYLL